MNPVLLTHTNTHQTPHSARFCYPIIHSLPLHKAVKQTPLQVPKDPRCRGQYGEAQLRWWDTLFKQHTYTHTHTHLLPPLSLPPFFLSVFFLASFAILPARLPHSNLSVFCLFTIWSQISLCVKKRKATLGKVFMEKYTDLFDINHKSSCDSEEHSIG